MLCPSCRHRRADLPLTRRYAHLPRAQLVLSLLAHEWSHCGAAAFATLGLALASPAAGVTLRSAASALRGDNLRGNVPLRAWAAVLCPSWSHCARGGGLCHAPYVLWAPPAKASRVAREAAAAFVCAAGPAASLALALAARAAHGAGLLPQGPAGFAAAAAPWLVFAAGVGSDLLPSGRSAYAFFCGNFGCILNLANGAQAQAGWT